MQRYLPAIYGGIAALLIVRGMVRGGLGAQAQQMYVDFFIAPAGGGE